MPNITLSITEELKKEMDAIPEINWSESVRKFLSEKVKRAALLKKLDEMLENSELTEKDALELGRKIKKGGFEKLKQAGLVGMQPSGPVPLPTPLLIVIMAPIVVDANMIMSLLIAEGSKRRLFFSKHVNPASPEFVLFETSEFHSSWMSGQVEFGVSETFGFGGCSEARASDTCSRTAGIRQSLQYATSRLDCIQTHERSEYVGLAVLDIGEHWQEIIEKSGLPEEKLKLVLPEVRKALDMLSLSDVKDVKNHQS